MPDKEFLGLAALAVEIGDAADPPARIRRVSPGGPSATVSSVVWGDGEPEVVLLHGGGQNCRTWDSVALLLGRPAVAIDLPGHGRSAWRLDHDYSPQTLATDVAPAIERLAPRARLVVGMSLGGLTTIRLAAIAPELVRRTMIVDVTPSVLEAARELSSKARGATQLLQRPTWFESFESMVDAAAAVSPGRSRASLERAVRHNARRLSDEAWTWRHDPRMRTRSEAASTDDLWRDWQRSPAPTTLVRGQRSHFVSGQHLGRLVAARPDARIEVVPGAGHSVQSDQPQALADLVREHLDEDLDSTSRITTL